MEVRKSSFISFPKIGIFGFLLFLLCGFHLVSNLTWISANTLPFPWDQAGHVNLSYRFLDFFAGKSNIDFLRVSDYYPPLTHLLVAFLMTLFGRNENIGPMTISGFFITSIILVYLYTFELFKKKSTAFLAALIYSFYPFIDNVSRYFLLEIPLVTGILASVYTLEKSQGFLNKKYSRLFGIVTGLALLVKWGSAIYLFIPVLFYLLMSYQSQFGKELPIFRVKEITQQSFFKNFMIAVALIVGISIFWYYRNLDTLLSVTKITATAEESDPQAFFSIFNFSYYLNQMANFMFTWVGLLGFFISLPILLKKQPKYGILFLGLILFSYLSFTVIGNKDVRYVIGLAPFLAITTAFGLVELFKLAKLRTILFGALFISWFIVLFFSLGFGYPFSSEKLNYRKTISLPFIGTIDLINFSKESSFFLAPTATSIAWPNEVVAEELSKHDPNHQIKILVVAEKPFFNQVNLELARRKLQKDNIEFNAPYSTGPLPSDEAVESYLQEYSLVLIADKDLGPMGGIRHIARMKQIKSFIESGKSAQSKKINTYYLPDGDTVSVYKTTIWPKATIVKELGQFDPNNFVKVLVLSQDKQINTESLESERKKQLNSKIQFISFDDSSPKTDDYYNQFQLVLRSEAETTILPDSLKKINNYYLPNGDILDVYRID